jgi:hypothetical protein
VLFNDAGAIGGDAGFTYNKTTDTASVSNLGIGTNSPISPLTVESTSNVRLVVRNSTENTSYSSSFDFLTGTGSFASTNVVARVMGIVTQADPSALQSALAFVTNSGDSASEKMRIDSQGRVGIGTIAPEARLDVQGGRAYFSSDSNAFATYLRYNASTAGVWVGSPSSDAFQISKSSGATHFSIDASCNASIGTSTTQGSLTVTRNFGNASSNFVSRPIGTAQGQISGYTLYATFQGTGDNGPRRVADIWGGYNGGAWGTEYLAFGVANASDSANQTTERLRIGPAGQIGIGGANFGTSGQVLTSNGSGSAPSWQTASGTPTLNVVSGTTQTAAASNHYVLTNASATTLTLPASPSAGAVVWVTIANGRTDNVIARNGSNINSVAEDMIVDSAFAGIQLRYADATRGWIFT